MVVDGSSQNKLRDSSLDCLDNILEQKDKNLSNGIRNYIDEILIAKNVASVENAEMGFKQAKTNSIDDFNKQFSKEESSTLDSLVKEIVAAKKKLLSMDQSMSQSMRDSMRDSICDILFRVKYINNNKWNNLDNDEKTEKYNNYDEIRTKLKTNPDLDKLKAILHLMALPRKNGFFTASYAETGSMRSFIKLINKDPQFEKIKKMIANDVNGPIGKKDILKFLGKDYTRLYEKFPPPNPRGADRGAHVRSSNL
jgi:predicted outer membrane protein